jgi:hypothetical protein
VIPKITKKLMYLVLTFDFASKANSNASTHTNYLITLLKNDRKRANPGLDDNGLLQLPVDHGQTGSKLEIRSTPVSGQTGNYTGEQGPITTAKPPNAMPGLICLGVWPRATVPSASGAL